MTYRPKSNKTNRINKLCKLSRVVLYQKYIIEKKSTVKIAKEIGFSARTIWGELKKFGIPTRTRAESRTGEYNSNWRGGTAEYQNHSKLKRKRKEAFEAKNYKCEFCLAAAKIAHHINGNKADHSIENLLVLCRKCHFRLHEGRKNKCKYRKLYGLSLREISRKTSLGQSTILNFFKKRGKPHITTKQKMMFIIKGGINE